jgi:hypothetical protein
MFFDASRLSTHDSISLLCALLISMVALMFLIYVIIPNVSNLYSRRKRHIIVHGRIIEKRCDESGSVYIEIEGRITFVTLPPEQFQEIDVGNNVELELCSADKRILALRPIKYTRSNA